MIIYLGYTKLPSKRANSYQTFIVSKYLSKFSSNFRLVVPFYGKLDCPFEFYNTPKNDFKIQYLYSVKLKLIWFLSKKIGFQLERIFYLFSVINYLTKIKSRAIIFTRDPFLLYAAWLSSCLNKNLESIFFEAHKTYNFLNFLKTKIKGTITTNNYINDFFKNTGFSNVETIPNGFNLNDFKDFEIPNYKEGTLVVGYIGRNLKWKGLEVLLESFKYLNPKKFKLLVAGLSKNELEEITKTLNKHKINFELYEYLNRKEIIELYKKIHILVLPNSKKFTENNETSPIKLFEYMASKRIILASEIPAIMEILNKKNAFFFESDNPKDLSKSIENITDIKLIESKINNAYDNVIKYSWQSRAKKIKLFLNV